MTTDQAADIIGVTASRIRAMCAQYRMGTGIRLRARHLLRGHPKRWQLDVNGQDVQRERRRRVKAGL